MKKIIIILLLGLSCVFVSCEENEDALVYIENNTPKQTKYSSTTETTTESKTESKTETETGVETTTVCTLNDYIDMRLWFESLDGEDGIDIGEATVLKNLCDNHEDFKMFEEALSNSIYKLYPQLIN